MNPTLSDLVGGIESVTLRTKRPPRDAEERARAPPAHLRRADRDQGSPAHGHPSRRRRGGRCVAAGVRSPKTATWTTRRDSHQPPQTPEAQENNFRQTATHQRGETPDEQLVEDERPLLCGAGRVRTAATGPQTQHRTHLSVRHRPEPAAVGGQQPQRADPDRGQPQPGRCGDDAEELLSPAAGADPGCRAPRHPIYILRSNTGTQMEQVLVDIFNISVDPIDAFDEAMRETQEGIQRVLSGASGRHPQPAIGSHPQPAAPTGAGRQPGEPQLRPQSRTAACASSAADATQARRPDSWPVSSKRRIP